MKKLLKSLEKVGKTSSLQQFDSVDEMLNVMKIETNVLEESSLLSRDLICSMDPGDDDED